MNYRHKNNKSHTVTRKQCDATCLSYANGSLVVIMFKNFTVYNNVYCVRAIRIITNRKQQKSFKAESCVIMKYSKQYMVSYKMWHIWRNNNACGLEDTATASYRAVRMNKNYLVGERLRPILRLLQTCTKQNHYVLQVFRMARHQDHPRSTADRMTYTCVLCNCVSVNCYSILNGQCNIYIYIGLQ